MKFAKIFEVLCFLAWFLITLLSDTLLCTWTSCRTQLPNSGSGSGRLLLHGCFSIQRPTKSALIAETTKIRRVQVPFKRPCGAGL